MKLNIFIISSLLVLSACESAKKEATESPLQTEVEKLHDVVMIPYMEIDDLKTKLATASNKTQADSLSAVLTQAQKDMDTWMETYKFKELPTMPAQEAEAYLQGEKTKILDIQTRTESSVKAAKALLTK